MGDKKQRWRFDKKKALAAKKVKANPHTLDEVEVQKQVALQVPKEEFNIDFRMFNKKLGDSEQHILIEKRYAYIGGGASGNTKTVKQFKNVFRTVHRYY